MLYRELASLLKLRGALKSQIMLRLAEKWGDSIGARREGGCHPSDKRYYRRLADSPTPGPFGFVLLFFLFVPFRRPAQPVHRPLLVAHQLSVRLDLEHEPLQRVVILFYFLVEQVHHVVPVPL